MQRASFNNLQDLLSEANQGKTPHRVQSQDSERSTHGRRLIMVSNHLPLKATSTSYPYEFAWDEDSLLYQARNAINVCGSEETPSVMFIGQLGIDIEGRYQDEVFSTCLSQFNCAPVFLPLSIKDRFYKGMCKQIMWPMFHYVLPMSPTSNARFDPNLWQAYIAANKKFADRLVEFMAPEDDYVWVHDYHLMLLPTLLRKRFHTVRVGFFLHSPFPSSEIFRAFPMREELLRGLLNADLVGFHTFDYARHFLSCCSRMLGLDFQSKRGSIALEYFGRSVQVRISPVGLHLARLREHMASADSVWRKGELEAQFKGKLLILGVDDMDPNKGIDLKCQAIEALLRQHPELVGRVVLLQVANPARIVNREVVEMRESVLAEVARINAKFTDYNPIELWERSVPLHERVALYALADCVLVTATRDGMNLVPYEYEVCRHGLEDDAPEVESMLVVSEFVGCTPSLSGALRVNPWNVEDTADHVYRALVMKPEEKRVRHAQHFRYVQEHGVYKWSNTFVTTLQSVCENLPDMKTFGIGFGLGFRVVALSPHFRHLDVAELLLLLPSKKSICFLLDYDGTLTTERGCSLAIPPSNEVLALLNNLTSDSANSVCIVSGRSRTELGEYLKSTPNVGIAAEHGCFYRADSSREWQHARGETMMVDVAAWKSVALPILESYSEATDGSFVQDKESAVVWHFHNADPDFGQWQSKELHTHLEDLLGGYPVDVRMGNFTVEIKPKGITKAAAVQAALSHMKAEGRPADLVLCIGDDRSDEDMFQGLETMAKTHGAPSCTVYSATVGQKPSLAPYYVNDQGEVLELLRAMVSSKQKPLKTRSYSMPCFDSLQVAVAKAALEDERD